jgi:hypothetical protein
VTIAAACRVGERVAGEIENGAAVDMLVTFSGVAVIGDVDGLALTRPRGHAATSSAAGLTSCDLARDPKLPPPGSPSCVSDRLPRS